MYPLLLQAASPASQFEGFHFNRANWTDRVLPPAHWPDRRLVSSPAEIVGLFSAGHYLEALAMVISWGRMWRQPDTVYGARPLKAIENALRASAFSIRQAGSITGAWDILTGAGPGQLGWSSVLASKTMHFLCRALGFERNPPVAIDNAVILKTVWPAWRRTVPPDLAVGDWKGRSLVAYLRYMTAILVWAEARGWTTTQVEATIFAEYL